jgi:hypothetical protein
MPAPIHTHDKVVWSRILKGELQNITYLLKQMSTGGLPMYEARHVGDKYAPENRNVLVKTIERYVAAERTRQTIHSGQNYTLPAHIFHEAVVPDSQATCTVVRMHSRVPGPVRILGTDGYPTQIEFTRDSRPADEVVTPEI